MDQENHKRSSYYYTGLLLTLTLLIFTPCFSGDSIAMRATRGALALFVLLSAVSAHSPVGSARLISLGLGIPGVLSYIAMLATPSAAYFLLYTLFMAAFFGHLMTRLYFEVFQVREVTGDTIAGAISIYLLFGITFSFLYALISFWEPGAFPLIREVVREQSSLGSSLAVRSALEYGFSSFLYFSFVTLTTLGYGDIAPAVPLARNVAVLEAVCGQFYLTVVVARLVALSLQKPQ